jgi:four helix bundle suffix protein
MGEWEKLIPKHGGYRHLNSFQVAQVACDVTARFCERYIPRGSRTRDQMQAARSGVQNIAEGNQASDTSRKTEIKLTSVARASLEELRLDYEDFLRQRRLPLWPREDPRRADLIARRPASADAVAGWARDMRSRGGRNGPCGQGGHGTSALSMQSTQFTVSTYAEIPANGVLALITVACSLLDRQIASLEKVFVEEGGFTERLYRVRSAQRRWFKE